MSRGRKLLIAGFVLVFGFALAWPFRKTTPGNNLEAVAAVPETDLRRTEGATTRQSISTPQLSGQPRQMLSPAPHVAAKMTSIGEAGAPIITTSPPASFDLANHPALARSSRGPNASPVTPPTPPQDQALLKGYLPANIEKRPAIARPAYATTVRERADDSAEPRPSEVRHVVQNSDTLEKLAKRYLGDKRRALEIFDLNRDVLDNPHLLPIDAELRIPGRAPSQSQSGIGTSG